MSDTKQDQETAEVSADLFSFEHKGKTYTFPKPVQDLLTPAWVRRNRSRETMDLTYAVYEGLVAGSKDAAAILDAIDDMTWPEQNALSERINREIGLELGKLLRSSS